MRYLLFNKPYGVLTQFTDRLTGSAPPANRSVRDTLKSYINVPDVYPVGRLDRDSEGLLLLTDDGRLAAKLLHPQHGHQRTYWAQVEGIPTERAIQQLQCGVTIQGHRTLPTKVRAIGDPQLPPRSVPIRYRKSIPTRWLELCLTEGKNRQVRRMTAAVGFPTLRLVRTQMCFLTLQGLEPGQWRDLTVAEVSKLRGLAKQRASARIGTAERRFGRSSEFQPHRKTRSRRSRVSRSSRNGRPFKH